MSKYSTNMLRTRRRDNNVKPNRRLDRKSSRGMLYENEELRLRTININAEIERGQYDIKKLKRENEMLKKEIWCLRDEYEKLDKMLKEKEIDFSSSSTTCSTSDSESCSSCTEESEEVETSQNLQNVQKTNMKNLHTEFDHLSVVPEETSPENSENQSNHRTSLPPPPAPPPPPPPPTESYFSDDIIQPDQSYPNIIYDHNNKPVLPPKNFFSPITISGSSNDCFNQDDNILGPNQFYIDNNKMMHNNNDNNTTSNFYQNMILPPPELDNFEKSNTDLIVKIDNQNFICNTPVHSSFSNGGNLEELLNDIETISKDILQITNEQKNAPDQTTKPYKSELNVVLMPNPMPLLGFEKYKEIQRSIEDVRQQSKSLDKLYPDQENPFVFNSTPNFFKQNGFDIQTPSIDILTESNLEKSPEISERKDHSGLELTSSEQISSENEENLKFSVSNDNKLEERKPSMVPLDINKPKSPKMSIRRKVSIHFKGKKDKNATVQQQKPPTKRHSLFDLKFGFSGAATTPTTTPILNNTELKSQHQKTPSLESRKSITDIEPKTPSSSDSKNGLDRNKKLVEEKKQRKSVSISPDRKHQHIKEEKKHRKHSRKHHESRKSRRNTLAASVDRLNRERSYSICTDRSNILDQRLFYDDYGSAERERTNSMSSCDTAINRRKLSNISNIPLSGKVPWCACWGNGCI